jgi:hypothetical protein
LVWEDPPPTGRPGKTAAQFGELLLELKKKPNTWAKIAVWAGESGAYSGKKRLTANPPVPGTFEYAVRKTPEGGSMLYARYVGRG